jgi:hypothetical protein
MKVRRGLLVTLAVVAGTTLIAAPAAGAAKGKKKKGGVIKIVSATATSVTSAVPGPLSATASCPSGRAVSGGFDVLGATAVLFAPVVIESSRVGEKSWRASFLPSNGGQSLVVEVYCAKLKGKITTVAGSQQLGASAFSTANPVASCPRRDRLISGGFQSVVGAPVAAPTAFATQNRSVGNGVWQAGFRRASAAAAPDQLTAYAYCLKLPKLKPTKLGAKPKTVLPRSLTQVSATGPAPVVTGAEASLTTQACPGKRRGVAGGFLTPQTIDSVPAIQQARFVGGVWSLRVKQADPGPIQTSFEAKGYCG